MPQPIELFRRPFIVKVMSARFNKSANARYFTLRFPRVQKIHLDRTVKETVSFVELQKIIQTVDTVPQTDDDVTNIDRPKIPPSSSFASSTLSNSSTSIESSQSSLDTATATSGLSQDEWMRAEGLVMIKEPKTITAESRLSQQLA